MTAYPFSKPMSSPVVNFPLASQLLFVLLNEKAENLLLDQASNFEILISCQIFPNQVEEI
jgi:hypothetical protein